MMETPGLSDATRLRVPGPRVIWETVERETLVIDLSRGYYYVLRDSASDLWTLALEGHAVGVLLDWARRAYAAREPAETEAVRSFLNRCCDAGLLEPRSDPDGEGVPASPKDPSRASMPSLGLPRLERYDDLEAMLLADPIHEFADQER